jgi:hypothetical protein
MIQRTPETIAKAEETKAGKRKAASASMDALERVTPHLSDWAEHWVTKGRKGSVKAMVALKCLDCTCYTKAEIRDCELVECSLHSIRPYQPK